MKIHTLACGPGTVVGFGDCGDRLYSGVTKERLDAILARLVQEGAEITGSNPYRVVTNHYGVVLNGTWDGSGELLRIEVVESLAPCPDVWNGIDERILQFGVEVSTRTESPPTPSPRDIWSDPPSDVPTRQPPPSSAPNRDASRFDERFKYAAIGVAATAGVFACVGIARALWRGR